MKIADAKLWSPDLTAPLRHSSHAGRCGGQRNRSRAIVRGHSHASAKSQDADGHWRFTLNGEPIFHWGPLDQGWWPDGLLTPPSDEAMLFDIEWLKAAGFNMIRKHIKVEPRRYYYHCDRLGMMVWQDHVSGGPKPGVDASAAESGRRRLARRGTRAVHARVGTHDRVAGESSVDRLLGSVQ